LGVNPPYDFASLKKQFKKAQQKNQSVQIIVVFAQKKYSNPLPSTSTRNFDERPDEQPLFRKTHPQLAL
jgi:hypothetical protein